MSKVIGTFALLLSIGRIRGIPQLGAAYLTVGDPTQVEQVGRVGVGPGEPGSVLLVVEVNTTTPGIPSSRLSPVQKVGSPRFGQRKLSTSGSEDRRDKSSRSGTVTCESMPMPGIG